MVLVATIIELNSSGSGIIRLVAIKKELKIQIFFRVGTGCRYVYLLGLLFRISDFLLYGSVVIYWNLPENAVGAESTGKTEIQIN